VAALAAVGGCADGGSHQGAAAPSTVAAAGVPSTAPSGLAVPAVQLTAAELPAGATEHWQPLAAPRTQTVSRAVQLNECASVSGALSWQQQAYVSAYKTPAEQDLFTFADPAAAQAATKSLLSQMDSCQDQSRALQTKTLGTADAQVNRTAATDRGTAWERRWTGVEGLSAAGPQTDHLYAVQQGSTIAVVHFDEWAGTPAAPDSSQADADLLTAVAARLG
jgi:hypothetical protein